MQKPSAPVDIWKLAEQSAAKHSESKSFERTAIFLGEQNSGKSSIISLIKGTLKEEIPKPTSAVDYSFARKTTDNRKEIVHFYELAGGRFIKDLTAVPLSENTIDNAIFIIVLDMSLMGNVLDSLIFWCDNIKSNVEKALKQVFQDNEEKIREYKDKKIKEFENCPDKNKITPFITNTIVLANKYDVFELEETENRKWMARILRYYCHVNGLSLYFSSIVNAKLSAQIKALMSGILFSESVPNVLQKDHMKPIFSSKGFDSLESIGIPLTGNLTYLELLKKLSKDYFPFNKENSGNQLINIDFSKYKESKIDGTKEIKDKSMQKIFRKFKIEIEGNINNEIDQNYDNEPTIKNDDYEQEKFEKVESKTDIPQKAEKKNNIEFKSNVEAKPSIPVKKFRPNLNLNKNF